MPSTPHVLDEARQLIQKRLGELDEERGRLERALAELGGNTTGGRGPRRQRRAATKGGTPGKRRRRIGGRVEQTVKLVEKSPGISASEIAKAMKIKPNYLYRVLGDLAKEKRVRKKGRKYYPVG